MPDKSFTPVKPQFVDVTITKENELHIKRRQYDYMDSLFHFHDSDIYELVWIEESHGVRFIGDNIGDFEAQDLVLVGPQLPHKWINDSEFHIGNPSLKAKTTVLHFKGNLFMNFFDHSEGMLPLQKLEENASRGIRLTGKSHQKAILLLERLIRQNGLKRLITFLKIINIFCEANEYELLASNSYKNSIMVNEYKRLNDLYIHVLKNFRDTITIETAAKICCMTPTAFCRFFKMHRNTTFIDFLNQIRVGHACKLLRQSSSSIADICFQSGYNNTANFNKFFRKVTGLTPSQYKRNLSKLQK